MRKLLRELRIFKIKQYKYYFNIKRDEFTAREYTTSHKSDVVDALQDVLDLTSADLRLLDDLVNIFYLLDELSRLLDRFLQERDSLLGL